LCLVAHPDDETIWCGGTLALLAAKGVAVHLAALTRGEGGDVGEPPLSERDGLGDVREREMVCAAGKLGARSLTFLGYIDPTVGPDVEERIDGMDRAELQRAPGPGRDDVGAVGQAGDQGRVLQAGRRDDREGGAHADFDLAQIAQIQRAVMAGESDVDPG